MSASGSLREIAARYKMDLSYLYELARLPTWPAPVGFVAGIAAYDLDEVDDLIQRAIDPRPNTYMETRYL